MKLDSSEYQTRFRGLYLEIIANPEFGHCAEEDHPFNSLV
jgi:hypothetical protein